MKKRGASASELYVIWVKMNDIQEELDLRNLCHLATKKKSYCHTKHPTKDQVKKNKRTMGQWIDGNKSVYIRDDLAYYLIRCSNLGVIKKDEFRKNLGVENDKSIRIEKEIIAIIMKIFAKENIVRQYQIPGLPYRVDLCFVDHKLVIEIDEDGHPDHKNDETRQKLIENVGFTFIRINPIRIIQLY